MVHHFVIATLFDVLSLPWELLIFKVRFMFLINLSPSRQIDFFLENARGIDTGVPGRPLVVDDFACIKTDK